MRCLLPNNRTSPKHLVSREFSLLNLKKREATCLTARFVGAHVSIPCFVFLINHKSTLIVLVFPVPGGPQIRLKLLLVLQSIAEIQFRMASFWELLRSSVDSLLHISMLSTEAKPFACFGGIFATWEHQKKN